MGAWSTDPLGNDDAYDLLGSLDMMLEEHPHGAGLRGCLVEVLPGLGFDMEADVQLPAGEIALEAVQAAAEWLCAEIAGGIERSEEAWVLAGIATLAALRSLAWVAITETDIAAWETWLAAQDVGTWLNPQDRKAAHTDTIAALRHSCAPQHTSLVVAILSHENLEGTEPS